MTTVDSLLRAGPVNWTVCSRRRRRRLALMRLSRHDYQVSHCTPCRPFCPAYHEILALKNAMPRTTRSLSLIENFRPGMRERKEKKKKKKEHFTHPAPFVAQFATRVFPFSLAIVAVGRRGSRITPKAIAAVFRAKAASADVRKERAVGCAVGRRLSAAHHPPPTTHYSPPTTSGCAAGRLVDTFNTILRVHSLIVLLALFFCPLRCLRALRYCTESHTVSRLALSPQLHVGAKHQPQDTSRVPENAPSACHHLAAANSVPHHAPRQYRQLTTASRARARALAVNISSMASLPRLSPSMHAH
ncbi:hypothetical protein IWX47DRAFT_293682 [Phyllosticta citricarpa]|uniref:Uncharacterized protein n=1 Tax=Phyllosticta citricarpa TaxID=55181 RepID=A0ABR1LYW8_9PEZI